MFTTAIMLAKMQTTSYLLLIIAVIVLIVITIVAVFYSKKFQRVAREATFRLEKAWTNTNISNAFLQIIVRCNPEQMRHNLRKFTGVLETHAAKNNLELFVELVNCISCFTSDDFARCWVIAAKNNSLKILDYLFKENLVNKDSQTQDSNKETILHIGVRLNKPGVVEFARTIGVDINIRNGNNLRADQLPPSESVRILNALAGEGKIEPHPDSDEEQIKNVDAEEKIPNSETLEAIRQCEGGEGSKSFDNVEELMEDLNKPSFSEGEEKSAEPGKSKANKKYSE